jgi:hypothetical protein
MPKTVESRDGRYLASVFLLAEALGVDVQQLIEGADREEKTLPVPTEQTVDARVEGE